MIIRPATPADYPAIRQILIDAFADHPYSHQTEHQHLKRVLIGEEPPKKKCKTSVGTSVNFSVKTLVKTPVKILQLLQDNPSMTLAEVAREIGKSLSAVERASAKLVKEGRLRYVGPQKGGHWEVLP